MAIFCYLISLVLSALMVRTLGKKVKALYPEIWENHNWEESPLTPYKRVFTIMLLCCLVPIVQDMLFIVCLITWLYFWVSKKNIF